MTIILPNSGDSLNKSIIVPGGSRRVEGPTKKIPIADNELYYLVKKSSEEGYLRHHKDFSHIVGCSNTGMFACLNCSYKTFGVDSAAKQTQFVAEHANCPSTPVEQAVGEVVVAE
jgi:hypothetical protein